MFYIVFMVVAIKKIIVPVCIRFDATVLPFVMSQQPLIGIKLMFKLVYWLESIGYFSYKYYLYLYNDTKEQFRTPQMQEVADMAIRAIDSGRVYKYILKEERTTTVDGEEKVMDLDEALGKADLEEYTVFFLKGRTARASAAERDQMLEVRTAGKDIVQSIHSGTMDLNLLLQSLHGVTRLLAVEGMCEQCGLDHKTAGHVDNDGYFIYEALMAYAKDKMKKKGSMANEVLLNHLIEPHRMEIAQFVRSLGGSKELGED